jgi:hypothetical protein
MYKYLILIVLFLVACSSDLAIEVDKIERISVTFFAKDSSNIQTQKFSYGASDIELEQFKQWVEINRAGWKPYIATVAVGDMMISGEQFTFYLSNDFAVVNVSSSKGEHSQYSKRIARDEFVQFKRP